MGYSARAIVGLGVEIDVQELTNAIVKHNEQLEETLDEDLYFDVDEHPDYKDPDSIYEFFDDEKINIELKNRNLYYDCTSYDYENQIFVFYNLNDINDILELDKNKLENIKKSILEFIELYNLKIIGDFGIQVAADYS
jgi:hypothetical protein